MIAFRPGLWPTLTLLLCLPLLLMLGTWQVHRLEWKTDLIATLQSRAADAPVPLPAGDDLRASSEYRRVVVAATFRGEPALRFGVGVHERAPGHRVLQAATLADGRTLVVDRGWVAAEVEMPRTPEGPVTLTGALLWIADDERRWPVPENDPDGNRWYWHDIGALETAFGLALEPVVLVLDRGVLPPGPAVPVPQPVVADLPNNHLGYAITWYGLAVALVVIYGVYGRQRGKERP